MSRGSRAVGAEAVEGGRGRPPSRRRSGGGTPLRRRRWRTLLARSAGGGRRGRGRWPTTHAPTGALRSLSTLCFTFHPEIASQEKLSSFRYNLGFANFPCFPLSIYGQSSITCGYAD